jgi:hypothetical protein
MYSANMDKFTAVDHRTFKMAEEGRWKSKKTLAQPRKRQIKVLFLHEI